MRLIIILFVFLFSCKKNDTKQINNNETVIDKSISQIRDSAIASNISGEWQSVKKSSKSKVPEEMFTLNIVQNGNDIKAQYCAIANSGGKIDCENEEEFNIKGILKDRKIVAEFYSFFSSSHDKGKVEIIINDNALQWKIIQAPKGEYYAPDNATLTKKNVVSDKGNVQQTNIKSSDFKNIDITKETSSEIIETYGCGDLSVSGMALGEEKGYNVFIVEDQCGDFPFKDLVSEKNGKIIDKLLIESSAFDVEIFEANNLKDKVDISFNIKDLQNIEITNIHSINDKQKTKNIINYHINSQGKFRRID